MSATSSLTTAGRRGAARPRRSCRRRRAARAQIVPPCRRTISKEVESPSPVPSPDFLGGEEGLEDPIDVLAARCRAVVRDRDHRRRHRRPAVRSTISPVPPPPLRRARLDRLVGVHEQIHEDLLELLRMTAHRRQRARTPSAARRCASSWSRRCAPWNRGSGSDRRGPTRRRRDARRRADPGRCGGCAPSPPAIRGSPDRSPRAARSASSSRASDANFSGLVRAASSRRATSPRYSSICARFACTNPIGLLISCATPAASRPSDAIFSVCSTCDWSCTSSDTSGKITTAPIRVPSASTSGADEIATGTLWPSVARHHALDAAHARAFGERSRDAAVGLAPRHRTTPRWRDPCSAPRASPRICSAIGFDAATRPAWSTTTKPLYMVWMMFSHVAAQIANVLGEAFALGHVGQHQQDAALGIEPLGARVEGARATRLRARVRCAACATRRCARARTDPADRRC